MEGPLYCHQPASGEGHTPYFERVDEVSKHAGSNPAARYNQPFLETDRADLFRRRSLNQPELTNRPVAR